jgi:hypothetical protein
MNALTQIAGWPVDAASDDATRYFFITHEAQRILRGERCLVVGGKGAGKTALSRFLESCSDENAVYIRLERSDYTFARFIERAGDGPAAIEHYLSMWRHFILTRTHQEMANASLDEDSPFKTRCKVLAYDVIASLRKMKFISSRLGDDFDEMPPPGSRRAEQEMKRLKSHITRSAGTKRFFIIFDELDEVFANSSQKAYFDCMTGLIAAAEVFVRQQAGPIKPIILLRDDIYDCIPAGRKGKWTDIKIDLQWDQQTIQKLLAFRIARAFDKHIDRIQPDFQTEWRRMFTSGKITVGSRMVDKFDFIAERTLERPRDYICFIKECADILCKADDGYETVNAEQLKIAERRYSQYLWNELKDLAAPYVSDYAFAAIEKIAPTFTLDAFRAALSAASGREFSAEEAARELRTLSSHNIIRNFDESANASFAMHRGLYCRLALCDDQ